MVNSLTLDERNMSDTRVFSSFYFIFSGFLKNQSRLCVHEKVVCIVKLGCTGEEGVGECGGNAFHWERKGGSRWGFRLVQTTLPARCIASISAVSFPVNLKRCIERDFICPKRALHSCCLHCLPTLSSRYVLSAPSAHVCPRSNDLWTLDLTPLFLVFCCVGDTHSPVCIITFWA